MRNVLRSLALAALLLPATAVQAGDDAYGGVMASALWRDSDLPVDTGYGLHLLAGKRLSPAFLGELHVHAARMPVQGLSDDISLWGLGVDVLYPFTGRRVQPFLLAGLGAQRDDFGTLGNDETTPYLNLGAGLFAPVTPRLRFRAEARGIAAAYENFPGNDTALDLRLNVGLTYAWAASAAPRPVARDVDADNDGVEDADDICPGTPAGQTVTDNGCVKVHGLQLQLNFARNSAKLDASSRPQLDAVADALLAARDQRAEIAGHTDSRGDAKRNQVLSQQRAAAVRDYLIGRGVAASRLEAKGYGADQPVDTNDTAAGRARNRRVELQLR